MINEVLAAVHPMLPERVFILLPSDTEPDLVMFSDKYKATVKLDNNLPVFVVVNRSDGALLTWGEGLTVADATLQAISVLQNRREAQFAA